MTATELLLAAYGMGLASDDELDRRWIALSHRLGPIAGTTHVIGIQRVGRLDMLLRVLEGERLQRMRLPTSSEPDFSVELQLSLSVSWLFGAYEIARAAKKPMQCHKDVLPRLIALEHRLALVRMPLAKGEIEGMNRKPYIHNPPMLARSGDETPYAYEDGSYIVPGGLCERTGSALWWPVDMSTNRTAEICRRDMSDQMLSLFE